MVIYDDRDVAKLPDIQALSLGTELTKNTPCIIIQYPVSDCLSGHVHVLLFTHFSPPALTALTGITDASNSVLQGSSTLSKYIFIGTYLPETPSSPSYIFADIRIYSKTI